MNIRKKSRIARAFTLIELLVVISIIGLLSSIVLSALQTARVKGYDGRRFTDLRNMEQALDSYYQDNGHYPEPASCSDGGAHWCTACPTIAMGVLINSSITGLTPTYVAAIPTDPANTALSNEGGTDSDCYMYSASANGSDYKFIDYHPNFVLGSNPVGAVGAIKSFSDTQGSIDGQDGWGVWSSGAVTW
jgi:prepilin-type N-terminal cleavage/methylation domain-containing protein